ncbi:hypothetical protein [Alkalicoccus chagannorensis]|uniref:hypothetical protein n=1 Tax=Alkalicoccus chagannorensis TaxID=427072 RepID=UPI00040C522E|nr:hypothetical protein [Alkalicoccus chagannorensis]
MINRGFALLRAQPSLALYPMVFDLLLITAGAVFIGYQFQQQFALELQPQFLLPSIEAILHDDQMMIFVNPASATMGVEAGAAIILSIAFFFVFIFVEGGYLRLLYRRVEGERIDVSTFLQDGRRLFGRFLLVNVLVILLLVLGALLVLIVSSILPAAGIVLITLGVIAAIVFRYVFIFWEYTIAAEDMPVIEALGRSRLIRRRNDATTIGLLVVFILINVVLSITLNLLINVPVLYVMTILNAVIMTGVGLAFMSHYAELRRQDPVHPE